MTEDIHWNDQGQPISTHFDDIYFSTENGLEETRYVFLQQNHLQQRFSALDNNDTFIIAETGFGTGLNFLATCELWQNTANKEAKLHFISVEKFPLEKKSVQRALNLWPELADYSNALIAQYPITLTGFHRIFLGHDITLTLIFNDAITGFNELFANPGGFDTTPQTARQWQGVDAWFLDGFAPSKNPDMWTEDLFVTMAKLSKDNTSLATFTSAGVVKRGLSHAGFFLKKIAGYGHKREMITGQFTQKNPSVTPAITLPKNTHGDYTYQTNSWAMIHRYTPTPRHQPIAIIGGGIAGCHTAYALARKGYQVTLFEKNDSLASQTSGNAQGIVYAKLSATQEPQGDFNRYCLLYAQQFYQQYWQECNADGGEQCGLLQLSSTDKLYQSHQKIAEHFGKHPNYVNHLSATEASRTANTTIEHPGLFFPQSGWIHPHQLCQWLSHHERITVIPNTTITGINKVDDNWQLSTTSNQPTTPSLFHTVIIANAQDALAFEQTSELPINRVRGQVTHYPVNDESIKLRTAICGKGYIAPATNTHCIGASFNLGVTDTSIRPDDHLHNLQKVAQQTPDLIDNTLLTHEQYRTLTGRVGFRCVTPDYLPIVGGVPITKIIKQEYQILKKNAQTVVEQAGSYHSNLYVNIGHGSRGLAYTPLCSEILASLIHGEPPPVPQALLQKLNPTRFIIRQLIRS